MKKLRNTEAELKKSFAYKKNMYPEKESVRDRERKREKYFVN